MQPPGGSSNRSSSSRGASNLAQLLHARQTGAWDAGWRDWQQHRLLSLDLSRSCYLAPTNHGSVLALAADPVERRYLMSGAADSTLEVFDVQASEAGSGHEAVTHAPLWSASHRSAPGVAHRYQVTALAWYPVDTGLALSGSADNTIKLWDMNAAAPAASYDVPAKVLGLAMSGVAASHTLVAVGGVQPGVSLLDPLSGANTHTLTGHRGEVWAVTWSVTSEYQLYSGDSSGRVLCWDVRRAGTLYCLDQYRTLYSAATHTTTPSNPPQASGTTANRTSSWHDNSSSSQGLASATGRAHDAAVTSVHVTLDGAHIITTGRDGRMRLWDAGSGRHLLVHYPNTQHRSPRPLTLSSTADGRYVFVPSGDNIHVYDIVTGHQVATLRSGHFDSITSCQWVPTLQRLFSAGCDGAVVAWEPKLGEAGGVVGSKGMPAAFRPTRAGAGDVDRWSEDEDAWFFGDL